MLTCDKLRCKTPQQQLTSGHPLQRHLLARKGQWQGKPKIRVSLKFLQNVAPAFCCCLLDKCKFRASSGLAKTPQDHALLQYVLLLQVAAAPGAAQEVITMLQVLPSAGDFDLLYEAGQRANELVSCQLSRESTMGPYLYEMIYALVCVSFPSLSFPSASLGSPIRVVVIILNENEGDSASGLNLLLIMLNTIAFLECLCSMCAYAAPQAATSSAHQCQLPTNQLQISLKKQASALSHWASSACPPAPLLPHKSCDLPQANPLHITPACSGHQVI